MPRRVQRNTAATGQLFVICQPAIRWRHRRIRHAKQAALHLQVVPQKLVFLVQMQRRPGFFLELTRRQKVIQMRMRMDDAHYLQTQLLQPRQNQLMIATRIHHNGFFSHRITDDRAVALQRPDGEGFADEGGFCAHGSGFQICLKPLKTSAPRSTPQSRGR